MVDWQDPPNTAAGASIRMLRHPLASSRFPTAGSRRLKPSTAMRKYRSFNVGLGTPQIDPLLPFEIGLVKGREASESGLRLNAQRANRRSDGPSVDARLFLA